MQESLYSVLLFMIAETSWIDVACAVTIYSYWVFGIGLLLAKVRNPAVHDALSYGKLKPQTASERPGHAQSARRVGRGTIQQLSDRMSAFLLSPTSFTPRQVWITYYSIGVFSAISLWTFVATQRVDPVPFVLILFSVQVSRRLFECLTVHRFSLEPRMSRLHLLAGSWYYVLAPVTFIRAELKNRAAGATVGNVHVFVSCRYSQARFMVLSDVF